MKREPTGAAAAPYFNMLTPAGSAGKSTSGGHGHILAPVAIGGTATGAITPYSPFSPPPTAPPPPFAAAHTVIQNSAAAASPLTPPPLLSLLSTQSSLTMPSPWATYLGANSPLSPPTDPPPTPPPPTALSHQHQMAAAAAAAAQQSSAALLLSLSPYSNYSCWNLNSSAAYLSPYGGYYHQQQQLHALHPQILAAAAAATTPGRLQQSDASAALQFAPRELTPNGFSTPSKAVQTKSEQKSPPNNVLRMVKDELRSESSGSGDENKREVKSAFSDVSPSSSSSASAGGLKLLLDAADSIEATADVAAPAVGDEPAAEVNVDVKANNYKDDSDECLREEDTEKASAEDEEKEKNEQKEASIPPTENHKEIYDDEAEEEEDVIDVASTHKIADEESSISATPSSISKPAKKRHHSKTSAAGAIKKPKSVIETKMVFKRSLDSSVRWEVVQQPNNSNKKAKKEKAASSVKPPPVLKIRCQTAPPKGPQSEPVIRDLPSLKPGPAKIKARRQSSQTKEGKGES